MLEDLEARWRDERTPQAGVRLAEALQQRGDRLRAEGILEAVETGLAEDPRDLASRVAVGGLRLALSQPTDAARVLEEVVQADPTHLKANKLLVEVYLELDQRERARDRLDLYRLLNEGDPEIESLEGLLVGVTVPEAPPAEADAAPPAGERRLKVAGGDPFSELVAGPVPAAEGDLFAGLAPAPSKAAATATLAALYQEQGHPEDAERVFREVIAQEPDNLLALEGLAALGVEPEPAQVEEPETPPAEPTLVEEFEVPAVGPAPAEDLEARAVEPEPAEQLETPSAEPSPAEEPEALPAELPLAGEAEPVAAVAHMPVPDDPEADRQRRIGVLRDYLARIQRGREAVAR